MQSSNLLSILLALQFFFSVYSKSVNNRKKNAIEEPKDYGEAVFLTQYIDSGDIEKARELSRTGYLPDAPDVLSYSGYITVNKKYNSNIFFWFFPALNKDKNAPVLLWFQGGPGGTGLFGLFVEHGPYVVNANMTASLKDYNWAETFQLIYVDNPVGAGFSFTDDVKGYVTTQEEMADDMYKFMQQFYEVFYEYRKNEFYIAGESYGGKYVPSLAYKIHTMGGPSTGINLKGIIIGNGMCDPETMMDYGPYLYNIGLIDALQANQMQNLSAQIVSNIRNKKFFDALVGMDKLIISFNVLPFVSLFKNFTGFDFYYNYLMTETPAEFEYFRDYIKIPQFKKAVHVGTRPFQNGEKAQAALLLDIMQSVKPKVAVLMDHYRVLVFNGQLDVIVPYPLTVNFLRSVDWKYKEDYKNAERKTWTLTRKGKTEIAGYYHQVKDFYEVLVRNAGHIVPYDQPILGFDLISRFLRKKPLS